MEIITTAGFAEVAADGLAMRLGGYLAAHMELEHYHNAAFSIRPWLDVARFVARE